MAKLTPEACRAARGILKWSMRDLAEASGVAWTTINQLENGKEVRISTEDRLSAAFDGAGVEITNGVSPGARVKPPFIRLLKSGEYEFPHVVVVPIPGHSLPHELPEEFPTEEQAQAWLESPEGKDLVRRVRAKYAGHDKDGSGDSA